MADETRQKMNAIQFTSLAVSIAVLFVSSAFFFGSMWAIVNQNKNHIEQIENRVDNLDTLSMEISTHIKWIREKLEDG